MISTTRPCPVCQGHDAEVLHHQKYLAPDELRAPPEVDIVSCIRCGVGFADLPTTQEVLDETYREHSKYADTSLYSADPSQADRPPTDAPWDLDRLAKTASWLRAQTDVSARVLDAGCATGALLGFLLQEGFIDLVGLDPSPTATAAASRAYGVPTVTGSFLDPPSDIGTFDVVVLSHVLEHLTDVHTAVAGMWSLTRPGGLVYIEVPDAERYAEYLVAPFHDFNTEHINHFSTHTLATTMQLSGFVPSILDRKDVLCSPTDRYPAVFGLFRRPPTPAPQPDLSRDDHLEIALQRYVVASHKLMSSISKRILEAIDGGPVVVWGAGQLSMKLLAGPLQSATVTAVVDSSPAKWGQHFGPIEVIGPSSVPDDDTPILITSIHHQTSIRESILATLASRRIIELR